MKIVWKRKYKRESKWRIRMKKLKYFIAEEDGMGVVEHYC